VRCSGRRVRFRLWIVTVLLAGCCGAAACGESHDVRAAELRDAAGSWAATLRLVTEEWTRGALPSHFVQSTTSVATTELQSAARLVRFTVGDAASAPADEVLARVPLLNEAVARGDRAAAMEIVRALASAVPPKPTPPVARPR
jgi:hypothetical protein